MKNVDKEAITVAEDLTQLEAAWRGKVTESELRRGSVILRRLLLENALRRAWHSTGHEKEPEISHCSLDPILSIVPAHAILVCTAAGGHNYVARLAHIVCCHSPVDMDAFVKVGPPPPTKNSTLSRFVADDALIVQGVSISRSVLIKLICNKLGGAHFDPHYDKKEGLKHILLDWAYTSAQLAERPIIFFELLAIGQALVASPQIIELCEDLGNPLPKVEHVPSALPGSSSGQSTSNWSPPKPATAEELWTNSGIELSKVGMICISEATDDVFHLAEQRLQRALQIRPSYQRALEALPRLYIRWSTRKTGPNQDLLRDKALRGFDGVARTLGPSPELLLDWATALLNMSTKEIPNQKSTLAEARARLLEAVAIRPSYALAYLQLGRAFALENVKGTELSSSLEKARYYFRVAIGLNRNLIDAHIFLASTLIDEAKAKLGMDREQLLRNAEEVARRADYQEAGAGSFSLSCIAALRQDTSSAEYYAKRARDKGHLPPRHEITAEAEFGPPNDPQWFLSGFGKFS